LQCLYQIVWNFVIIDILCFIDIYLIIISTWIYIEVVSGMVHTGMEVHRIDLEMSGLVEQSWLQLMCYAVCLLHSYNFRWRKESPSGSEYWLVCRHWTLEVEFNKSLSSLIIRLVNYNVTTSLIYKLIV